MPEPMMDKKDNSGRGRLHPRPHRVAGGDQHDVSAEAESRCDHCRAAAGTNAVPPSAQAAKPAAQSKPSRAGASADRAGAARTAASPEQIVTLSNEFVRVDFTSWGGGVRSVELLQHKGNSNEVETLNGAGLVPALSLGRRAGRGKQRRVRRPSRGRQDRPVAQRQWRRQDLHPQQRLPHCRQHTDARRRWRRPARSSVVIGTAAPTQPREIPSYLVVDWEGASKFRNRTLPRVTDRVKAGKPHEDISRRMGRGQEPVFHDGVVADDQRHRRDVRDRGFVDARASRRSITA